MKRATTLLLLCSCAAYPSTELSSTLSEDALAPTLTESGGRFCRADGTCLSPLGGLGSGTNAVGFLPYDDSNLLQHWHVRNVNGGPGQVTARQTIINDSIAMLGGACLAAASDGSPVTGGCASNDPTQVFTIAYGTIVANGSRCISDTGFTAAACQGDPSSNVTPYGFELVGVASGGYWTASDGQFVVAPPSVLTVDGIPQPASTAQMLQVYPSSGGFAVSVASRCTLHSCGSVLSDSGGHTTPTPTSMTISTYMGPVPWQVLTFPRVSLASGLDSHAVLANGGCVSASVGALTGVPCGANAGSEEFYFLVEANR